MATYGRLRDTTILGQAGTTWYVQLWKKDYTGASSEMTLGGGGFDVIWSGQGGTRDRQFINSECVLDFISINETDNDLLYDIFNKGDRQYFIRVYKNGLAKSNIWWFGWIQPSFSKLLNDSFPYNSSITATDSIGTYSKQAQSSLPEADFSLSFPVNNHIKDFGDDSGIYNSLVDLLSDGTFPLPNVNWNYATSWVIPSGGGSIDYDGSSGTLRQTGVSITQGDDITFSITILNLAEGEVANIAITNESGDVMLQQTASVYLDFSTNGNHIVSGASLESATEIKLQPQTSATSTFSVTEVSIIDGLISNPSPCPTNNDWFQTSIDWWASESTYQSNDPFNLYRISKLPFRPDPEQFPSKYLKYDVLKDSLKVFNTTGVLSNGKYNFIQPNSLQDNDAATLPFYSYKEGDEGVGTSVNKTNLLDVNGTINADKGVVMAGSTITYEPPFKSVSAKFKNGSANILIHPSTDYSNYGFVGNLQQDPSAPDEAYIFWNLNLRNQEVLTITSIDNILPSNESLKKQYFHTKFTWDIKIDDGTTTYYLTHNPNDSKYHWVLSEPNNQNSAGFSAPPNSNPTQQVPFNSSSSSTTPCNMFNGTGADWDLKTARTSIALGIQSELPPITGAVSVKLNAVNYYYSWQNTGVTGGLTLPYGNPFSVYVQYSHTFYYPPSPVTDSNSLSINDEGEGIIYFSEQTDIISEESFDFKELTIGSSGATAAEANNVQYLDSTSTSMSVSGGFRRGGTGGYANIAQLLCSEFLSLQVEPLEILQADIFSPDIDPIKVLKYSIDDDLDYKYYSFLGGKFSAQTETMKGEWFKLGDLYTITDSEEDIPYEEPKLLDVNENKINELSTNQGNSLDENSLAASTTAIVPNISITKITISGGLKGKVYDGQKLVLNSRTTPTNLIVTVNGTQAVGVTQVNINAITPTSPFGEGSTLSVLTYDLSNVITGGSSGTPYGTPDTVKVNISHSEYAALDLVPKVLIPAPGVGKTIVPSSIMIFAERSTTETSRYHLFVGDRTNEILGSYHAKLPEFMAYETSHRTYMMNSVDGQTIQATPENVKLQMYSNRGFNGNIELTVYVTYTIMDI